MADPPDPEGGGVILTNFSNASRWLVATPTPNGPFYWKGPMNYFI